jgi:DNA replication and repair protein RecF
VGESHQCLVSATHLEGFGGGWQQQAQILGTRELRPDLQIGYGGGPVFVSSPDGADPL